MDILTIDFETYYAKDFGLRKFTTEEYIRDKRFEVIGVAVKKNNGETKFVTGTKKKVKAFLDSFDWSNSVAIAHNARFDLSIMSWHFGIVPKKIADTLCMARAIHTIEVGGSLSALVQHYKLGAKGTEVLDALGKRRLDFSPEEMEAYGGYCINDVELTYALFGVLAPKISKLELNLIDLTLRMFTEPVLEVDRELLITHLNKIRDTKEKLLSKAKVDRAEIMSNPKFAALLRQCGVEPPTKISLRTGKEAFAFAKTDEGLKELQSHANPLVQILVATRLGVKSTIDETRTERLIAIGGRGKLPIPLKYYAAHTGRWGGDDKVNMQNLPRGSILKKAICAPDGYKFIDCDLSQIEARTLAWLAEEESLVEAFDRGDDVYKIMASAIYGKAETEITKEERFVGKTTILGCIGAGTRVLCETGWKPIEQVTTTDRLWDGENWVCHQGLLEKGLKETVSLCGSWLTPDHKILCGTRWVETESVVQGASTLSQALVTGAARLPLEALSGECGEALKQLSLRATAAAPSTQLTGTTLKTSGLLDALCALSERQVERGFGSMLTPCQMTPIGQGYSTDFLLLSHGVITQETLATKATGAGVYGFTMSGGKTEPSFSHTYRRLKGGMTRAWKWIAPTTTEGMSQTTYGSQLEAKTCETPAASKSYSKKLMTYDLAYAGPNNRFTIWTDSGPVIAHNCGYGMGAVKFKDQLKTFGVELEQDECDRIVRVYRETYSNIPRLWRQAGSALQGLMVGQSQTIGKEGVVVVDTDNGIKLPNGLYVKYPNLRKERNEEDGRVEIVYDTKRGRAIIPNRIYGGKVIENVCQALARIVLGEQLLRVAKRYKVVMTVHDAIGCIAPIAEVEEAMAYVEDSMKVRPAWALDLPLDCEGGYANSYGEC